MDESQRSKVGALERLLLTVPEAAALTGLGRSKAYELVADGEWPSVRIGRSVRVPVKELRDWVREKVATDNNSSTDDRL